MDKEKKELKLKLDKTRDLLDPAKQFIPIPPQLKIELKKREIDYQVKIEQLDFK